MYRLQIIHQINNVLLIKLNSVLSFDSYFRICQVKMQIIFRQQIFKRKEFWVSDIEPLGYQSVQSYVVTHERRYDKTQDESMNYDWVLRIIHC
jgi:hypothetical protein